MGKIYIDNWLELIENSTSIKICQNNCFLQILFIRGRVKQSNVFFFSTGIINSARTCIIHQNEIGPLWIISLLLNIVTTFLKSNDSPVNESLNSWLSEMISNLPIDNFLHVNAQPHTSIKTRKKTISFVRTTLPHPSYSQRFNAFYESNLKLMKVVAFKLYPVMRLHTENWIMIPYSFLHFRRRNTKLLIIDSVWLISLFNSISTFMGL